MVALAARKLEMESHPEVKNFIWLSAVAFERCAIKYPMINRIPTNQDQQGPDDYKGLCVYLAVFGIEGWARDLLDFGANSSERLRPWLPKLGRWLNNSGQPDRKYTPLPEDASKLSKILYTPLAPYGYKPWVSPWMGRFPAITETLEATAKRPARIIPTLFSFGSLMQQALFGNKDKPDSWYMDWTIVMSVKMNKSSSFVLRFASKLWFKKLYELYPNGLADVWRDYVEPQYRDDFPLARFFYDARDL